MDYVKLISKEGHAFYVARECAMQSAVIEASLRNDADLMEKHGEITLSEVPTNVLEKVCQYMYYKTKYAPQMSMDTPEFPIEQDIVMDLLKAANYLEI